MMADIYSPGALGSSSNLRRPWSCHDAYKACFVYLFIYLFIYLLLGPHPQHMEVPRLGVESKLQLPTTATPEASSVCNLHHSSWPHWILNELSKPEIETASSWILVRFVIAEPQRELPKSLL